MLKTITKSIECFIFPRNVFIFTSQTKQTRSSNQPVVFLHYAINLVKPKARFEEICSFI